MTPARRLQRDARLPARPAACGGSALRARPQTPDRLDQLIPETDWPDQALTQRV
ncbi:hypothetical protein AB0K71_11600 [Streptomyces syringium]|uniref:hypothetical protein n=1 Tax=Streptomyces syringium TaxID=76729 RepID=UPI003428FCB2